MADNEERSNEETSRWARSTDRADAGAPVPSVAIRRVLGTSAPSGAWRRRATDLASGAGWIAAGAVICVGGIVLWHLLFGDSVGGDVWLGQPPEWIETTADDRAATDAASVIVSPATSGPVPTTTVVVSVPPGSVPASIPATAITAAAAAAPATPATTTARTATTVATTVATTTATTATTATTVATTVATTATTATTVATTTATTRPATTTVTTIASNPTTTVDDHGGGGGGGGGGGNSGSGGGGGGNGGGGGGGDD